MSDQHDPCEKQSSGCCLIEIRVRGQLGDQWSDWFENMVLTPMENGEMILSGPIRDQAALIGILNKLNRLNLTLLSVNETSQKKFLLEGERNGSTASIKS